MVIKAILWLSAAGICLLLWLSARRILAAIGGVIIAILAALTLTHRQMATFILELLWRAIQDTLNIQGVPLSAVAFGIFIFLLTLIIKAVWGGGWRRVIREWRKNVTEGMIATAIAYVIAVIVFLMVEGHKINKLALSIKAPNSVKAIPPKNWNVRSVFPRIHTPEVLPEVQAIYKIMPTTTSPYEVNSVKIKPNFAVDSRLYLSIKKKGIKNVDFKIRVLNAGDLIAILNVKELGNLPGIVATPVVPPVGGLDYITVIGADGKPEKVVMGSSTPSGSLITKSALWHLHCDQLFADTSPEFLLVVDRPHHTKTVVGFLLEGTYEYETNGNIKPAAFSDFTRFSDDGIPYKGNPKDLKR